MIKYFCDICGKEIVNPEKPTLVTLETQRKSLLDDTVGWDESDSHIKIWAHQECIEKLIPEIKKILKRKA